MLRLIADRPGVRAGDLAEQLGRERLAFKADVRKLKALGLTESLGDRLPAVAPRPGLARPAGDPDPSWRAPHRVGDHRRARRRSLRRSQLALAPTSQATASASRSVVAR